MNDTTPNQEAHTATPLTDAVINNIVERSKPYTAHIYTSLSEHARTLERRNAALIEALERLVGASQRVGEEGYNFECDETPWDHARRALELARTPTPGEKL